MDRRIVEEEHRIWNGNRPRLPGQIVGHIASLVQGNGSGPNTFVFYGVPLEVLDALVSTYLLRGSRL
jgi:hypothetical protein